MEKLLVEFGLEKDRGRRYQTAATLALDVSRYLLDEPVEARRPTAAYRLRKLVRRNRVAFGVAAALLVALTAGLLAWNGLVRARAADQKRLEV